MIYDKYLESSVGEKVSTIFEFLKKGIKFQNIVFVIISLILSSQSLNGEFQPFSVVLLGVASVFNVPLILILLSSVIGLAINSIATSILIKLIAFFILFTLITALVNIEGISKKYSVFVKLIISFTLVEIIANIIMGTFVSNILLTICNILIVSILYFIFVSGMSVFINIRKSYIYSREESIAMITVVAMALSVFSSINIFGFSIFNVLIMILVLIFGWRNGAISGSAAGLVIGLILTSMTNVNMTFVVSLAVSGGIAGILSRFGKVPVVIGFIIGNIYIAYYSNGFSELTMRASELLIASISLLFMPKALELKLSKLFNKNNTLDKPYENVLDTASHVKNKIGAVSEVFENLASITLENTPEDLRETRAVIQKYIEDYIENSCIDCKSKKECLQADKLNITVDYIASKLENNEAIDESMLGFDCDVTSKMVDHIKEVYNSMKLMRVLKQKEKENTVKLSNQYKEVSKILSSVAKNIKTNAIVTDKSQTKLREELKFYGYIVYEDEFIKDGSNIEYTFVTDILNNIDDQKKQIIEIVSDILEQKMTVKLILNSSKKEKSKIKLISKSMYEIQTSIVAENKSGEHVSGDAYLSMELQDLKHLSVISDGGGSGINASRASNSVINMLEKLLEGGFEEEKAIEIINSIIKLKPDEGNFSTIDISLVNLKNAQAEFIKLGAAPTYIVEKSKVITINTLNMPVGVVKDTDYVPICKELKEGSLIIQISDGVVKDDMDINNNYFKTYLETIDASKNCKTISDELHKLVLRENKNILEDDVTILVTKIIKS